MVLVLIISLLAGAVLAEFALRTFSGLWFHNQLRRIVALLQAFHKADGDDARQALLLSSGRDTLLFSLAVLGLLLVMAVIASLAPWLLKWTDSQLAVYFVGSSVAATGWWLLWRTRRRSSASNHRSSNHAR